MTNRKFFIVNPYNQEHILKLEKFAKENNILPSLQLTINLLTKGNTSTSYFENLQKSNEIEQIICLEEKEKIIDCCNLYIEKDIRSCYITLYPLTKKIRLRKIIPLIEEYAFNALEIEEIFIRISPSDEKEMNNLIKNGFENLGRINGIIHLLKEREHKKEIGMGK